MYTPREFAETRLHVIHEAIRANPFATLITSGESGLVATHLPFILDAACGEFGTLRGHMARANRQWREFDAREVLVVFAGPHAYISPNWYESAKAAPTWNYIAVHAYGVPRLIEGEAATVELLRTQVATFESPSPQPWTIDGLDRAWLASRVKAVMAFEIPVRRFEGKAKMSQNRPAEQERVAALLDAAGKGDVAREIRALVAR
jgi:transcriptional regulator